MNTEINQKIQELIDKSTNILLLIPYNYDGESISTAMAFYNYLKQNKDTKIVDLILPQKPKKIYTFLPKIEDAKINENFRRRFVLSFDTSLNKVRHIDSSENENNFNIIISSEPKEIDIRDVSIFYDDFYDLVILFGCKNLESLEDIYTKHKEFFQKTKKVNIDFSERNEMFADINFVDSSKNSLPEIVFDYFGENHVFIDSNIANCLMSGFVFATRGFSNKKVTSSSLEIASKLMDLGAEREKIIQNIYQTKSISLLRAWGNILSDLSYDNEHKVAWSELRLSEEDLQDGLEIEDLIDELISKASQAEIIVLFQIIQIDLLKIYIYSDANHNSYELIKGLIDALNIKGNEDLLSFDIIGMLQDVKRRVLDIVRENAKLKNDHK